MTNTHAGKAESYDLGRPDYPAAFFDFLYGAFGLRQNAVIADIGAGPGKVTKGFAERGSRVFAVEPDEDMRRILRNRLSPFAGCTVLGNSAEDTGIPTGAVDLIFCGNSYYWFDRRKTIPEFRRILKPSEGANVVLAWQGGQTPGSGELAQALERYKKPLPRAHDTSPPFREGAFETREFGFTLYQDWSMFLHGNISASFRPGPRDDCFEEYCQCVKDHFERYSEDGKFKTEFTLTCMIGNANELTE